MDPRRKPDRPVEDETPTPDEQGRERSDTGPVLPDSLPEGEDLRHDLERAEEAPGEDDDNPYQNSDEALPEDGEEAAIARNPSRKGGRFDEV